MGELVSAEAACREAKQGFLSVGFAFAAALAGLDLALVLLRRSRVAEGEGEVVEAASGFASLNFQTEILGVVAVLQEALRLKTADLAYMEDAVRYIRWKGIWLGVG
jgi:hypothetical protein